MIVEVSNRWEVFVRDLVASGRFSSANDAVDAALAEMKEREGEKFQSGSLAHLYTSAETNAEHTLASSLPVPLPESV